MTGDGGQVGLPDKVRSGLVDALRSAARRGQPAAQVRLTGKTLCATVWCSQIVKAMKKPQPARCVETEPIHRHINRG